jgi:lipid-A-disaccharide synthase
MPRIFIVTGEASGDVHGANLARALKALDPGVSILGVGGARMRAAGVELVPDIGHLDFMGLIGPAALRTLWKRVRTIRRLLKTESFDAVVLIDNPGLNFHFARIAKRIGLHVIYYITPQVWAWRPGRMRWMQRRVDHAIVILPFEEELYRRAGVSCTFVGHPLLDEVAPSYDRDELRKRFGLDSSAPVVGLLPGSREGEVRALFPAMLQAAANIAGRHPGAQFIVAQAPSIAGDLLGNSSAGGGAGVTVRVVQDQASEVMAVSDALLVASGTSTLQAAVIGTPMVLTYRTSWLTCWLARRLIRIPWIGLVNIVAGRSVVPELIQQDATPERMSEEASRLLADGEAARRMKMELRKVREALGSPGASRRAAAVVLAECRA